MSETNFAKFTNPMLVLQRISFSFIGTTVVMTFHSFQQNDTKLSSCFVCFFFRVIHVGFILKSSNSTIVTVNETFIINWHSCDIFRFSKKLKSGNSTDLYDTLSIIVENCLLLIYSKSDNYISIDKCSHINAI